MSRDAGAPHRLVAGAGLFGRFVMRDAAHFDLLACGLFFTDMTFTGLPSGGPRLGHEIRVGPYVQTPGGIANSSIAAARLGLSVCMAADVGDDPMTVGALAALNEEGIETCHALVHTGWQTPLTVLLNYDDDRALVTSETAHPGDCMLRADFHPSARVAITHLQPFPMPWLRNAADAGTVVIGDTGWDGSGRWQLDELIELDHCQVFTPNETEALHYTRRDTPEEAIRVLAERVPLPVITLGARGVMALDAGTGEFVHVPPIPGPVVDTGGAGDVFSSGLAAGLIGGLPLADVLRLGTVVSAVTISRPGGASTAPALDELKEFVRARPDLGADYGFIADLSWDWAGSRSCRPRASADDAVATRAG